MSPASHTDDDRSDPHAKGMAVFYAIALVGSGLMVAAFLFAMDWIRIHRLGVGAVVGASLVFGAGLLLVVVMAVRTTRQAMGGGRMTGAAKRYGQRVMIAMGLYVVTLSFAIGGFLSLPHGSPLAWLVAAAPALPVIGVIVAMARYLREETDEFERTVQAEAALWATGGLLAIATLWGFLELFGLAPHAQSYFAVVIWFALLGPSQVLVRRRFR
jgi:hypothetical protein